jgi:hypothetical protein
VLHTAKILNLLKNELEYNLRTLTDRQSAEEELERIYTPQRLKDELWNAFSDGGELQWIRDLDLIDSISTSYYYIRIEIYLEEMYFEAMHYQGPIYNKRSQNIQGYLKQTGIQVIKSIQRALEDIEQKLKDPRRP